MLPELVESRPCNSSPWPAGFGNFTAPGCVPDSVNGAKYIRDLYEISNDTIGKSKSHPVNMHDSFYDDSFYASNM